MVSDPKNEEWTPGSFTKNFSWGRNSNGLRELHHIIRLGFDNKIEDVPRDVFRERVAKEGRPVFVPINFFLFNVVRDGVSLLLADELVFQAITSDHSPRFDKLALFAFNFSFVGVFKGGKPNQRYPALWARRYISDMVARKYRWDTSQVNANDIQRFVDSDARYKAKTSRKLATNLNYLYSVGRLAEFSSPEVERWWVDSLFLALDRLIEDRALDKISTAESQYREILERSSFSLIAGQRSLAKEIAIKHLVVLYIACGSRDRFSEAAVKNRTLTLPDISWMVSNDQRPKGAVHPSNPSILKSIPWACAMLAVYAGFQVISADELDEFDPEEFVRRYVKTALDSLKEKNIIPTMSVEELMKLTRRR